MKQLTPRDLNTLSKEDMAAMILQMQTTINTLSEQLNIINANKYGRKSEKLKVIEGQMVKAQSCVPRRNPPKVL